VGLRKNRVNRDFLYNDYNQILSTKITIITACLNANNSIRQTIESVITQTYSNIEYIIVDGGSTDGTMDIISEYRNLITHVISEKDKGLYFAMNKGVDLASGHYIGIINADDWYSENAIGEVVSALSVSPSADIIYGDVNYFLNQTFVHKRLADHSELDKNMIPHPGVFCRASIFRNSKGFNTKYQIASDYDFLLKSYMANRTFRHTGTTLANYSLGGFSDKPKNVILSIFEKNSIRNSYNLISNKKALTSSTIEAIKTIYRRHSKMKMTFFLLSFLASSHRKC
jgi:glycosyltransferase involved in cell wall biosynthesis